VKSSPKVSVIIPNYNHAPYLKQRIESVLNQTYKDFELILLDDASTDNSLEVIQPYIDDPKITHLKVNNKNSGSTFKQWQKGIDLAQGEYIWIAESDDWAQTNFLHEMVLGLEDNEKVVLASSQIISMNSKEEKIKEGHLWTVDVDKKVWNFKKSKTIEINSLSELFAYKNILPNASSCVFRKNAIDPQVFLLISRFSLVGDLIFWFHLSLKGDLFLSKETVSYCRFHENNVGRKPLLATGNLAELYFSRKYVMNRTQVSPTVIAMSRKLYAQLLLSQLRSEVYSKRKKLSVFTQALRIWLIYPDIVFYALFLTSKKMLARILP
jgi:glycosyltransferase involved in cell wall biosynthesis